MTEVSFLAEVAGYLGVFLGYSLLNISTGATLAFNKFRLAQRLGLFKIQVDSSSGLSQVQVWLRFRLAQNQVRLKVQVSSKFRFSSGSSCMKFRFAQSPGWLKV